MPILSIVILTYNSSSCIKDCLESVFTFYAERIKRKEFELILFDNNSSDNTIGSITDFFVKKLSKEVKISKNEKLDIDKNIILFYNESNLGFAGGINKAVGFTKGDFLLLLNPDAKLADANIDKIINFLKENKEIAIAGGKIKTEEAVAEQSAGRFYNIFRIFFWMIGLEEIIKFRSSPEKVSMVDYVSGGFMIIKRQVFDILSGFDVNYFMYIEDMDFCYRARKKGYATIFTPVTSIIHKGQGSSDRAFAITQIYKGIMYFYKKNGGNFSYFLVKLMLTAKALILIFLGIFTNNAYLKNTYKKAINIK